MTANRTAHPAPPAAPDRLSRLKAFLQGVEAVEIISSQHDTTAADYLRRFFLRVAAPVAVASALAVAPTPGAAAQPTHGDQLTAEAKSILSGVRSISSRYLAHGRTPTTVAVEAVAPDYLPQRGPTATTTRGQCTIEAIRLDYTKVDRVLARMTATPESRAFVLIHEHTHCRTGLSFLGKFKSAQTKGLAANFKEASSDAMAILMIARRDGVPAALSTLQTVNAVRTIEAVDDPAHDTRPALSNIEAVLKSQPARFASDAMAFETALIEGARGAAQFHEQQRQKGLASVLSREDSLGFAETLRQVAEGYRSGAADGRDTVLRAMGFHATQEPAGGARSVGTLASLDPDRVKRAAESALFSITAKPATGTALAHAGNPVSRIRAVYETQRLRSTAAPEEDQEESTEVPRQ